jgi:hypothetical protein
MRTLLAAVAALPLLSASAFGWGCEGHEMVALIARAHLTPQVSAEVDRLLRANPVNPVQDRNCRDHPIDLMALSASWADAVKAPEKNGEWHYIDIPRAVRTGDAMKWCGSSCIVTAFEHQWAILRDKTQPDAERAKALRYVVHLIGDLSTPLHQIDNHDQAGNCDEMRFYSDEMPQQLHGIWDYRILQRELGARKLSTERYAQGIDREFRGTDVKLDVLAWVWESHDLAVNTVYGLLNPPLAVAPADAGSVSREQRTAERASVAAMHISIDDAYVHRALPVIRKQIALAGYRLATLLNQM